MKETVNDNIASQAFTLDDDAYAVLRRYLDDPPATGTVQYSIRSRGDTFPPHGVRVSCRQRRPGIGFGGTIADRYAIFPVEGAAFSGRNRRDYRPALRTRWRIIGIAGYVTGSASIRCPSGAAAAVGTQKPRNVPHGRFGACTGGADHCSTR